MSNSQHFVSTKAYHINQIYDFLISLPADQSFLDAFDQPATLYRDVFNIGQPYKCLYVIYALMEYLKLRTTQTVSHQPDGHGDDQQNLTVYQEPAVKQALSIIVGAVCDPDVTERCSAAHMRIFLGSQLVAGLARVLRGKQLPLVNVNN